MTWPLLSLYQAITLSIGLDRWAEESWFFYQIFLSETIEADWSRPNSSSFECLLPQPRNKDIIIGSIYRPPGHPINDFLNDFDGILPHLSKSNCRFLAEDFDINLLRHCDHPPTDYFFNIISSNKFIHIIHRPTRITETAATLVDNIFTNCSNLNQDSCILINYISDHLPILLFIDHHPLLSTLPSISPKRNFNSMTKIFLSTPSLKLTGLLSITYDLV